MIVTPRIFGKSLFVRAHGTRVYLTNGDRPEIQVFDTTGSLLLISRISRDPVPVTRELTNAFLEEVPSRKAYYERFGEAMTYPQTLPPFGALIVDDSGRIWVQDYPLPGQSENNWLIIGPDGVVQNTLRVPSSITIRGVRGQRALTVYRDSLGEESVRVYRISTAQTAP